MVLITLSKKEKEMENSAFNVEIVKHFTIKNIGVKRKNQFIFFQKMDNGKGKFMKSFFVIVE